eukprot:754318-Hanusia_phi.AAC.3
MAAYQLNVTNTTVVYRRRDSGMVVHMTAAPRGCGRDLYIFMRPEVVQGKVTEGGARVLD